MEDRLKTYEWVGFDSWVEYDLWRLTKAWNLPPEELGDDADEDEVSDDYPPEDI